MNQFVVRRGAVVAVCLGFLGACATQPVPLNLSQTLAQAPQFSTLSGLVVSAGLAETLSGQGPFTVFAPTNEAFSKVPQGTLAQLQADPTKLRALLLYHVIPGAVVAADVKNGNVKTVNGANVAVAKAGAFVTVEESMVEQADLKATNGVVHSIDRVLTPPATR